MPQFPLRQSPRRLSCPRTPTPLSTTFRTGKTSTRELEWPTICLGTVKRLRASVSRYVTQQGYFFSGLVNPVTASVNSTTRNVLPTTNLNAPPVGNPLDPAPNGDYTGAINPNFGQSISTLSYASDVNTGWQHRPFNWEYTAVVQQQLSSHISLEGGYFRRTFGNQTVTDNESVTPADYTPFCFNLPAAAQLGVKTAVGLASLGNLPGSQICGAYDIIPSLAGVRATRLSSSRISFPERRARLTTVSTSM